MSFDEDDEWDDEPFDDDESDVANCPECGAEVYEDAERCDACGHWFLPDDRRRMRDTARRRGGETPITAGGWMVKIVAVLLALLLLAGLLM